MRLKKSLNLFSYLQPSHQNGCTDRPQHKTHVPPVAHEVSRHGEQEDTELPAGDQAYQHPLVTTNHFQRENAAHHHDAT